MSITLLLSGRTNVLESTYSPPISLDRPYLIGLTDFVAYNSIPNIFPNTGYFVYDEKNVFKIPDGAWEIDAIETYLKGMLGPEAITLRASNSTFKCDIKSEHEIDFTSPSSLGSLLGFSPRVLSPRVWHTSDLPIQINPVNIISLECNVATGSYVNGTMAHTLFAFAPNVPPGFKMALAPRKIIYSQVNTQTIDRLTINIVDQSGKPVSFGGEEVTARLHLRPADG